MIQFHKSPDFGETLTGEMEDNNGKVVSYHSSYGKYEILLVTTKNGTPVGCVARQGDTTLAWEDNTVRGAGLLDLACKKANNGKFKREFDFHGHTLKVERHEVDMFWCHNNADNNIIICVAIKPDGEVLNFWCDADYRKSKSLDMCVDIAYGVALSRGWIAKGIDSLFSLTAIDNIPSVKYQLKIGCKLQGFVTVDGIKFGIYRYSAQSRIDKAKEVAYLNGVQVEF